MLPGTSHRRAASSFSIAGVQTTDARSGSASPPTPAKHGVFEWLVDWASIKPLLIPLLNPGAARWSAISLGCGTSALSAALADEEFVATVTSVDRDCAIIALMRSRYEGRADLTWEVADIGGAAPLRASSFDLAIDKSTLDAMLAENGDVAALACDVWRCLKAGGVWSIISFHEEAFLRALLVPVERGAFECVAARKFAQRCEGITLLVLRKVVARGEPDEGAVRAEQRAALDTWYTVHEPLLTAERRAHIAAAFRTEASLPLSVAFDALFSAEEKALYSVADFVMDVEARHGAGCGAIRLDEAIRFLEENQ